MYAHGYVLRVSVFVTCAVCFNTVIFIAKILKIVFCEFDLYSWLVIVAPFTNMN